MFVIRKRMRITEEQAVFIFINNSLPKHTSHMSQMYHQHADRGRGRDLHP